MSENIHCYNKGCGQKFNPSENNSTSCTYHPGPEQFHDAYKIWKCCNKKSTDFSTWLNYKGCAQGLHNGEKLMVEAAPLIKTNPVKKKEEVIVWNGLNKPAERIDPYKRKHKVQHLSVEVSEQALKAIDQYKQKKENREVNAKLIGSTCKNSSCKALFDGTELDNCVHHPGGAVFHEGMKYWSCCKKKTSDFSDFMDQIGCTTGSHCWSRKEIIEQIREDWFSRCGFIHINIYCKGIIPEESIFKTDGLFLNIQLSHGFSEKNSQLDYELWGEILPEESRVVIGERKMEVILKQAGTDSWPKLRY